MHCRELLHLAGSVNVQRVGRRRVSDCQYQVLARVTRVALILGDLCSTRLFVYTTKLHDALERTDLWARI